MLNIQRMSQLRRKTHVPIVSAKLDKIKVVSQPFKEVI